MFRAERVNVGVRDHGDSGSAARFFKQIDEFKG
jgi:hypothetical protein